MQVVFKIEIDNVQSSLNQRNVFSVTAAPDFKVAI